MAEAEEDEEKSFKNTIELNLRGRHTLPEAPSGAGQELIVFLLAALEDKAVLRSETLKIKVLAAQSVRLFPIPWTVAR